MKALTGSTLIIDRLQINYKGVACHITIRGNEQKKIFFSKTE